MAAREFLSMLRVALMGCVICMHSALSQNNKGNLSDRLLSGYHFR